ncbi:Rpn family recombination-promoting nuclease/putative transposase [Adlercreutzia muris]|jgi:predicted transposase/invertase (TIGR01784 family)|uniref:Rpn family recombination-promoting nuclease/putative transposase n=1 Tax=Adlercreutzia muris TaxID=1796610 RepID=UPI00136563CA|nr:Rpn family recombination-promoting nuclease/putative transposase [Adlercreutzia muris]MCI8305186.1 Rpn family recombination-promoting nuclease/putative transposase [Enterorhabdus sp.]NCA31592.1 Rpn family recombination-promoting nuclease/putative transposase [Adlercreutzia muris]
MSQRSLKFSNRWMFNRVMCRKEVCARVLHAALGIQVGEIRYLNAEQAKEPTAASRGVRMDVFAKDDGRVYDVEMQLARETRIGRRMRYYQAAIDVTELGEGEDYELLPESFVIFICAADAFGAGVPVYTIERVCLETPDLSMGDDSHWIVLNASASEGAASPDLRDLLHYVRTGRAEGSLSRQIDSFVEEYNRDREWVTRVLTYEQDTKIRCRRAKEEGREEGLREGLREGREEGRDELGALMAVLLDAGRIDDARRASKDAAYRDGLMREFGL